MTQHQVLFCPFCRERFEGRSSCPEHELRLLPLDQIRVEAEPDDDPDDDPEDADEDDRRPRDERPLALLDPRYGRGVVALGALLAGASLGLELVRLHGEPLRTYELARGLPSLWTVLLVSFCALYVVVRRRTPRALRSLRVLVPLLGGGLALTLTLAALRLGRGLAQAPAAYAIAIAALLLVVGGARLGTVSTRA
jgi:hypothetical protein